MYKIFSWLLVLLCATQVTLAQNRVIKGTVTDGTSPVAGVTVSDQKNLSNSAVTDADGKFSITLKDASSQVLVFSSVGYLSYTLDLKGKTTVTVALQTSATDMNEVMVVGYGRKKKITNTGAVSMVTGVEIRQSPAASLQNSLVGRLPGFFAQQRSGQPGRDGSDFYIRGISSYNSSANPLIIVDDIEVTYDQVKDIDPNEIESLSILKDASTTAVYGVKGANGVLVITTRRGKEGKPKVNFRSEVGLQKPTIYFNFLPAHQDLLLMREKSLASKENPVGTYPDLYSDEAIQKYKDQTDPYSYPSVNWIDELSKKSTLQLRDNIDISGGTKNVKYFISGGYVYQDGIFKNFSKSEGYNSNYYYKRYNFRSNLDITATPSTTFRFDLSGRFGETNEPYIADANMSGGAWPIWRQIMSGVLPSYGYPVYNPDGTYGAKGGLAINPVGVLALNGYERSFDNAFNMNFTGNQKLDFLTKGLALHGTVAFTSTAIDYKSLYRNNFPAYDYNSATGEYTLYNNNKELYRLPPLTAVNTTVGGTAPSTTKRVNMQASLTWNRDFGDHNFAVLALYNQYSYTNPGNTPAFTPENFKGYTGRVTYNFREKYLLEVVAGYNGTDRFKASSRYGFFPAVSAGWNVSKEKFFENIKWVDNFKIRASWGKVGSDQVGGFQYLYEEVYGRTNSTSYGNNYSFGETHVTMPYIVPSSLANNDVRWEMEEQKNLGIDLRLMKGKLGITADVFDRYRYDILDKPKSTPSFAGLGSTLPAINLGRVSNKGFEVELSYSDKLGALNYFVKGNYTFAKNKILFSDEVAPTYPAQATTGRSIGQFFGYVWSGQFYNDLLDIDTSAVVDGYSILPGALKMVDVNGDRHINDADKTAIGNPNRPNTYYGFSLGVSYKGFDVSAMFQGTGGSSFYTELFSLGVNVKTMNIHQQRWTPATASSAQFARLGEGGGLGGVVSTYWLRSANYLRLKNVELGYKLPAAISRRLHVESVRFYANGLNLYTWFNLKIYNIDPENTSNGTSALNSYPQQKVFNAGLSVTF
ncbi:TonB-dependent receptor [Paraflavitalea sp. CAU 1676]|uniref:SusC/RagA family TonB-linked outer membrane protein n=1 Tax=Paraflavitalea sp. CAU 1676 TaxID=3032598 RepID=UPI0023D9CF79|nr:TonB-dependent receptor [Paraflavitalea sp. CAU 1676]MDF2188623.1 TonB-dependent receptor [Paraflavitalea sp. CAU 1676]